MFEALRRTTERLRQLVAEFEPDRCDGAGAGRTMGGSCSPRPSGWARGVVSKLNTKHMQLAWTTLATLMITDGYIALVASGAINDLRFYN